MIALTSAQVDAWLAGFLYPMARILALLSVAPVLGNRGVPTRIKLGLGLVLTFAIAPLAAPLPDVAPASWQGLGILVQQIVIGLAMGMVMRIVFAAADFAGELIGLQMGLGFATFFNPQIGNNAAVMAQLMGLLSTLFFLALNGHLMIVATLAESFAVLPVSTQMFASQAALGVVSWGSQIFLVGLALALPVLAALLITNLALGVLTRTAPQLNIFAVGFPITLMLGFFMLALVLPYLTGPLEQLLTSGFSTALEIARLARATS